MVRLSHPDLDTTVDVPPGSVPALKLSGWRDVDSDPPAPKKRTPKKSPKRDKTPTTTED